ncbi:hypothetical protein RM553_12840 [Zunongwangia sp. F363]|uniref:Uncharacterized protein n=1 Tax=Autumnicola tepida TaxID=3075595 RepID=A0ABU3CBY0_9FLAO|nr:hypothetical protein [Zunongwangia sp. F363]MDT0643722.1 hypothetical protein [Zunongwangia sp. F363]
MRKITLLLALLFVANFYAQDKTLAKVHKVNGIEVYILSEPLRDYDVVFGGDNKIQWTSALTGGLVNASIESKVSKFVKSVQEKSEEENVEFDAIVYSDGKNVSAIKFTEEKTDENERMAEVQKMDGIPLFILSEPVLDYTVEYDKGGGIKWKSLATAGLINNSIEEDVKKYVKKLDGKFKREKIDAIMYADGKEADGIKFRS